MHQEEDMRELLRRAYAGDGRAENKFFTRAVHEVGKEAVRCARTGQDEEIKEIIELSWVALVKLWNKRPKYALKRPWPGYLIGMVRKIAISIARKAVKRKLKARFVSISQVKLSSRRLAQEGMQHYAVIVGEVEEAIEALPTTEQREIARQCFNEGRSIEDIARSLGKTRNAVDVALSRIRKKLENEIDP